ncbi:MAG: twin transmembrane helix small protein [Methylophilaceae bacterium]|nr:twin transmembrane helix small protein [Methylophilaceae bacterium]
MLTKAVIVFMLLLILASLFSALFYMFQDKGQGDRTAKALTLRISLSIGLFFLLLIAYKLGLFGWPS